jgi:hypothetical protein
MDGRIGYQGTDSAERCVAPAWLGTWLQRRYREGFSYHDAEQLCLRMYYKFDGIPPTLRHQLSRLTLAATFAELARSGWIRMSGGTSGQAAMSREHWLNLLTPNYRSSEPVINTARGEAVFQRLLSGFG